MQVKPADRICVACPMQKEAEALRRQLGTACEILATGLGIKRSLPPLLRRFRENPPDLLIFTGSASQLDLALEMGDIVLAEAWCIENGPCFDCHKPTLEVLKARGFETCSKGLSIPYPVIKAEQRQAMHASTGARIYDSVTAAVVRIAGTSEVACIAPKMVAGTVKSGLMTFWNDLDRNIGPLADYIQQLLAVLGQKDSKRHLSGVNHKRS